MTAAVLRNRCPKRGIVMDKSPYHVCVGEETSRPDATNRFVEVPQIQEWAGDVTLADWRNLV